MERGTQYPRELAVWELIYNNPDKARLPTGPDKVQCIQPMWWKSVQSAPTSYGNSLAALAWRDEERPSVEEVASQLRQYKDSISSLLQAYILAVERLSEKSKNLFEKLS